jgi:antitoxin (DNA-binding transcriptional repressor) of toxin-antitoxin stability system
MRATVQDLRYRFSKIEDLLGKGHEVEITRRKPVIARLIPPLVPARSKPPDFPARLKKIYGKKILTVSGAELLSAERERY